MELYWSFLWEHIKVFGIQLKWRKKDLICDFRSDFDIKVQKILFVICIIYLIVQLIKRYILTPSHEHHSFHDYNSVASSSVIGDDDYVPPESNI